MINPTKEMYSCLQLAYNHFNKVLFNNALPPCLLTLQRNPNSMGYFSHKRFVRSSEGVKEHVSELALNPDYFAKYPTVEMLQTIAHEQCHVWQFEYGNPSRKGYHNKEWSRKMLEIGLQPVNADTGRKIGAVTGQNMCDKPINGGLFMEAVESLLTEDFKIAWFDTYTVRVHQQHSEAFGLEPTVSLSESNDEEGEVLYENPEAEIKPQSQTRTRFECPTCHSALWGKPSLKVMCMNGEDDNPCNTMYEPKQSTRGKKS